MPQSLPPSSAETERPAHGEPSGASDLILQAAGDGIYGLDAEGITTFANPAAEAMTGYLAGELIGKPQHAMIHHSYADGMHYPRNACPIYLALRDGLVHHSDTEVFWRKDGTSFPVVYTSTPILKKGRPIGATVVFRDISEENVARHGSKARTPSSSPSLVTPNSSRPGHDRRRFRHFFPILRRRPHDS